ncbi:type IV secretory system conjugative DNA transfer family protein [Undibacterium sp. TS12]|uniref:type IV secretory system conjugative DNA transfer family protein n=1 Tax=Undibacterium sp. TS12 TaxID=2908202 RepID=UPI001F4CD8D5|nr:type IV secretory system conjugative DNA transfer family protein [Undibacterium sp. TS12]MCH8621274.1 type IV secretion system DotC family protein [Undibacterium sp. TS12]
MFKAGRILATSLGLLLASSVYALGSGESYVPAAKVEGSSSNTAAPQLSDFSADNISKAKRSEDDPFKDSDIRDLRIAAVREAAYGMGIRNGLVARSILIKEFLYRHRSEMDRIFNFASLMLDCGKEEKTRYSQKLIGERPNENCVMQPPVILGAKNLLNDKDGEGEVLRYSKASFRIKKQARLITTIPVWENYLIFDAGSPGNDVHPSLFPKNDEEKRVWNQALAEGWDKGVEQANAIYRQNLAVLHEDFSGMQRYQYLLLQNLVSKPFVSRNRLGITGNGKTGISIDDITLTITERPEFNLKSSDWMLFPSF